MPEYLKEPPVAARTGKDFLDRLAGSRPTVHVQGETLTGGVRDHPAFRNVVRSYAELYDLQHADAHKKVLTYTSPTSGEPVATSFLTPTTPGELRKRRQAFAIRAEHNNGMLGRTGDYLNSALMAMAAAAHWFAEADPAFGENVRRYYARAREQDLLLSHTLIPPQVNRAQLGPRQAGGSVAARIVREDDNGVVIRGARMLATIAPFADDLLVLPSTVLRGTAQDRPYSYAFTVPMDAKGLRCVAREPLDVGLPRHDRPLASRFDDVHVPYERCFLLGDVERCNELFTRTSAVAHMLHQVVTRTVAKTEYVLGLVSLLTEAIGIHGYQHVQEDVAEVTIALETLRAFLRAVEADATVNEFGVLTPAWAPLNAARNLYPKLYQRFPQILRKLGASGLMATPTALDVTGPAAADIDAYLQAATLSGAERVKPFRTGVGHLSLGLLRPTGPVRVLLLRRPGPHRRRVCRLLRPGAVQGPRALLPRRLRGHGGPARARAGMTDRTTPPRQQPAYARPVSAARRTGGKHVPVRAVRQHRADQERGQRVPVVEREPRVPEMPEVLTRVVGARRHRWSRTRPAVRSEGPRRCPARCQSGLLAGGHAGLSHCGSRLWGSGEGDGGTTTAPTDEEAHPRTGARLGRCGGARRRGLGRRELGGGVARPGDRAHRLRCGGHR